MNMRRKILITFLLLALTLLALDRIAAAVHLPRENARTIILYTTSWCAYCNSLRLYLATHRIPFKEHDVETSLAGIMGFWALRARGVPVSVIGPTVVHGYDINRFDTALRQLGYLESPSLIDPD